MVIDDLLKLILDYYPYCKLIKMQSVNKSFKRVIDDIINYNCENNIVADKCVQKFGNHKMDIIVYAFQYGCVHLLPKINYGVNHHINADLYDLALWACKHDLDTCWKLLEFVEYECFMQQRMFTMEEKMGLIKSNKGMDEFIKIKIMEFQENHSNNANNQKLLLFALFFGGKFDYFHYRRKSENSDLGISNDNAIMLIKILSVVASLPSIFRVNFGVYFVVLMLLNTATRSLSTLIPHNYILKISILSIVILNIFWAYNLYLNPYVFLIIWVFGELMFRLLCPY